MQCPRCGNEWDATKGACTRCGFIIRTTSVSGSLPPLQNSLQRNNQQAGGLSSSRLQSGGVPPMKQPSGGATTPVSPGFPRSIPPGPVHQQDATLGSNTSLAAPGGTFSRPAFEKNTLRKIPAGGEQSMPQPGLSRTEPLRGGVHTPPPSPLNRSTEYQQQDFRRQQMQVQAPSRPRTNVFPPDYSTQSAPNQQASRPSFQPASGRPAPVRTGGGTASIRPLLPGVLLRGGRYRLQELQERQDWLSGVFEAIWTGKDSHRGDSRVTIIEVVLPENTSVMTQTILRTATMSLASVGRHPHIPTLWDAFSDQGRSFFVFEPVEGESLMARMRYSGRALPEQEVIECCLQMTDVLDLLAQQSPQLVHGLIRPEHILVGRNGSYYILTNFSIVLAGGATQYIVGLDRSRLSPYAPPEFVRGVVDVRTDMYSLIASAYHAVTGSVPAGIGGSVPQAQRINPTVSPEFDAILAKGLRAVANQRYQRPSELRQDLLAMRSVSGSLVSGRGNLPSGNRQPIQRSADNFAQALPLPLNTADDVEERASLLPRPEDLPPMRGGNDALSAALLLCFILACCIVLVMLSHMGA
jgi:Protein kinase domain